MAPKPFISHSSADDDFVRELRHMLADLKQDAWVDSRKLRGGDDLWASITKAIDDSSGYVVVVSPDALQSPWVEKELRYALAVRKKRGGNARFPVVPILLNGTKLGALQAAFGDDEPVYISATTRAGGVEALMNPLLVALNLREPSDVHQAAPAQLEPAEELVLHLSKLSFHDVADGVRRPSAEAKLVYDSATSGLRQVESAKWQFVAPIGPIEAGELRWYLEKYAIWPSEIFGPRARKVEEDLATWGQLLHDAAMPVVEVANVMQAWARIDPHAARRFSVYVDSEPPAGASEDQIKTIREAATLLLGLPWELLRANRTYLFQGAKPTRVRRRLPNTTVFDVAAHSTPIRVLLVTARPEDDACGYIDHRASALPLVETMEALGGLVRIQVLSPPTLRALSEELQRAFEAREPYHVVHFDGHGVYDRRVGLGGLCFEDIQDEEKLDRRRHQTVYTDDLGPLLKDYNIPLVFLEACQTAQAEKASESVASELLKTGVSSVVAMSHSVLVETARRFVQAFYKALAGGKRVGDAMLMGQRALHDDRFRGKIFGAGDLKLHDWFVPVLFQEKEDPQLFRTTPQPQTQEDILTILKSRFGALPAAPDTGFVGRSRDLLALERLLRHHRYAVVRGQGGEGKTTLAAEFARWMVRSHQIRRAAFVSVETHTHVAAVVDALGRQLVGGDYSVATFENLEKAILPIESALAERSTLLVVDNMESILLPPYLAEQTPEALSEDARRELQQILTLCARLNGKGQTRLLFTSREPLPAPFDAVRHRRELHRLDREDAVKLVERALNAAGAGAGASSDAATAEIEQLVDAVQGHARTLALLGPALLSRGVAATRASLVELMAEMDKKFPNSREKSVYASVELSLRRLSPANRERARVLGLFHGGVDLDVLRTMMQWEMGDVMALAVELIETGMATANPYNHLTLNPALCPYLRGTLAEVEREELTARWTEAMRGYVAFLDQQGHQDAHVAATLTVLELPNLFALLDLVQRVGDAEATVGLVTSLYSLLQNLGKRQLVERLGQVRDAAATALGETWSHWRFNAARTQIEQQLGSGQLRQAFDGAQRLLQRARQVGERAYPGAAYDLAAACFLAGRVLKEAGGSQEALPLLEEAQRRFEMIAMQGNVGAVRMASVCITERGDCLTDLGRLDDAAAAYVDANQRHERRDDKRTAAAGKIQLGTVRLLQRRHKEALSAYAESRDLFAELNEPHAVAVGWHQIGIVHQESGQPEAAEDAYRKSLAIKVQIGDVAGQASTLGQLGNLYDDVLNRPEEAVAFYRQAASKYVEIGDRANEGRTRNNLGDTLRKLRRPDEARQEIRRAIECKDGLGHAAEPWKTWDILADIETDAGDVGAAAEAKRKAITCYLAYRRDGGENHSGIGRICHAVTQALLAGQVPEAVGLLEQLSADPNFAEILPFLQALQAIVAGSRDRVLAEASKLHYSQAAEILFLIETLDRAEGAGGG